MVATPGRAVDHLERGSIRLDEVETVVLDEADEMLDMGFADDLERILGSLPEVHQTALFSATISGPIARLAGRHLRHPVQVRVQSEATAGEASRVRQVAYVVRRADKLAALGRILDLEDGTATLVFARTRGEVDDLAEALSGRGRDAAALHGGLAQEQRDRIMGRFRDGALDVLVATDVAARGLDIEQVTHVVNYDVPSSPTSTSTASAAPDARAARASPSPWWSRASTGCCATSSGRSACRSSSSGCRRSPTSARSGSRSCAARCARRSSGTGSTATARSSSRCRTSSTSSTSRSPRSASPTRGRGAPRTPRSSRRPRCRRPSGRGGRATAAGPIGARSPPSPAVRRSGRRRVAVHRRAAAPRRRTGRRRQGVAAGRAGRGDGRPPRPHRPVPQGASAPTRGYRVSGWRDADGRPLMRPPRGAPASADVTRLFVGAGRAAGMRPGDLVGAIANEAGLSGGDIGAIQIADGFSLVDVPADSADRVISALRGATIRGLKVNVRRERY